MKYRVRIKQEPKYKVRVKLPEAKTGMQVQGSLYNDLASFGGAGANDMMPKTEVRKTITKVSREEANLEAEGGETVLTFDPAGYPLFYEIKGPRHSNNGVPLNLPDDSFIFSDTRSMRVNDQEILDMFGLSKKKGGYTPADISKKYLELNKYREKLQSADSDKIAKASAERMIKNMLVKLGALAIAQESKKGFPQGIPSVAKPYMDAYGISEEDILPQQPEQLEGQPSPMEAGMEEVPPTQAEEQDMMMSPEMMDQAPMAMYGTIMGGYNMPFEYAYGGDLQRADDGGRPLTQAELEERRKKQTEIRKEKGKECPPGYVKLADGTCGKGTIRQGQAAQSTLGQGRAGTGAPNAAWRKTICDQLSKGVSVQELADQNHGTVAGLTAQFADCIKKGQEVTASGSEDVDFLQLEPEEEIQQQCECEDPTTGEMIYSEPDADGNCPPCSGYEKVETEGIQPEQFQQPGTVFPEDVMNLQTAQRFQLPRKDPAYVGPRGTQLEMYGIDPRGLANTLTAGTSASQRALTQMAGSTPGAALAGMYAAQKAQAQGTKEAFDQANKFNTDTRNQEIMTNTQLRQSFLDKEPAFKLDYDAKLAQQIQNQARNKNEKAAAVMAQRNKLAENSMNLGLVNASFENKAYDPITKKVITTKGRALRQDPNAAGSGQLAARTKEIMNSGIEDPGTAYKIAMQELQTSKFGGVTMFEKGGYVYTVFPALTL